MNLGRAAESQRRIVWYYNNTYHFQLDDVLAGQVPEYLFKEFGRNSVERNIDDQVETQGPRARLAPMA